MVAVVWAWMVEGQTPQRASLPSVQYNKFTAAGAQQLAASLILSVYSVRVSGLQKKDLRCARDNAF